MARTFYIDFATGSDSGNNGLSKGAPWKRDPKMTGFAGTYTHQAEDQFIFKGGETWDHTCFPMIIDTSGTSAVLQDLRGVDVTWFTGGVWTRPIWDNEYVSCTTHRVVVTVANNWIVSIEMKRILASNIALAPSLASCYDDLLGVRFTNCYLHGWRTTAIADDAYGGFCMSTSSSTSTCTLDGCEIENSENIGIQRSGVCVRNVPIIQNGCRIHDNSSGVLYCNDFNGSYLYNISGDPFDPTYHANGIYMDSVYANGAVQYIRNSYLSNCDLGANMAYPNPRNGGTITMYNNVLYGTMSAQCAVEIQTDQHGTSTGYFNAYNNTIANYDVSKPAFNVSQDLTFLSKITVLNLFNNYVINAAGLTNASVGVNVVTYNNGTNILQSAATAAAAGSNLGNLYNITAGSACIGTGTDESGTFTTDILGATRSAPWDVGAYKYSSGATASGRSLSGRVTMSGRCS